MPLPKPMYLESIGVPIALHSKSAYTSFNSSEFVAKQQ